MGTQMLMAPIVTWALWLGTLVLTVQQSSGQCYLEDEGATCSVCWRTDPDNGGDARSKGCGGPPLPEQCKQDSVDITWDVPLPEVVEADTDYAVRYTLKLDLREYPVVAFDSKGDDWHVPHSNIHSCPAGGAMSQTCTPFVKNDGTLSTHTPAIVKNFTFSSSLEHVALTTFESVVNLPLATYTIIIHGRVYTHDPEVGPNHTCWPDCLPVKNDFAVGVLRKVVAKELQTSSDAYIATGVVGALILFTVVVIGWTARTGRLNLDAILRALSSEEVVLTNELLLESGDIIAFTVSVFQEVLPAPEFANLKPAFILALILGWLVSIFMTINMLHMFHEIFFQRFKPDKMKLKRSDTALQMDSGISWDAVNEDAVQHLFKESERARRAVMSQYSGIISVILKDLPMCSLGAMMLGMGGGDVEVVVLIAFFLSSAVLGSKARSIAGFTVDQHTFKVAREALGEALKSDKIRTSWRESAGISNASTRSFLQEKSSSTLGRGSFDDKYVSSASIVDRQVPLNETDEMGIVESGAVAPEEIGAVQDELEGSLHHERM